VKSKNQAKFR